MNTDSNLYKSVAVLALVTGILLLIPLVAMQFSDEVVWTLSDFVIAGLLLFGTGLSYKLITWKASKIAYRIAVGFALFTGLFLIWVNLAVGLIGSEDNPANLMYFGVIMVGVIGAFISDFRSRGLSLTMFAMALAQMLAAIIALLAGMHQLPDSSMTEIVGVNGFFIALFVLSALLFRHASKEESS